MAKVVFWLLMMVAFAHLLRAWPYVTRLRRHTPLVYIFPTKTNRSQAEFGAMWRSLGVFYLLIAAACLCGLIFLLLTE